MNALKVCPFCGNHEDFEGSPFPSSSGSDSYFVVRCGNPACEAEVAASTPQEAVGRWNNRAQDHIGGTLPDYVIEQGNNLVASLKRYIEASKAPAADDQARAAAGDATRELRTAMHEYEARRDAALSAQRGEVANG